MNKCKEHYDELSKEVWKLYGHFVETTPEAERDMTFKVTVETLRFSVILDKANDGFDHCEDVTEIQFNRSYELREELSSIVTDLAIWIGMMQAEVHKENTSPDKRMDLWRRIASRLGDIKPMMTQDYEADSKSCMKFRNRIEQAYFEVFDIEVEDR